MRHVSSGVNTAAARLTIAPKAQTVLRELADNGTTLVWTTDAEGRLTILNPATRFLFRDAGPVHLSDWLAFVHADDAESVRNALAVAREEHTEYRFEYRIVRSDSMVRWMLCVGAPRFAEDGTFAGHSGATIEMPHHHEAFARLAASEANYRLLAEQSSDLICHCDAEGIYTYVSPSYHQVLDLDASVLIGENAFDRLHPDDRQALYNEARRQRLAENDGGECPVIELRVRHRNGHYLWLGTKVRVLRDPVTGAAIGSVVVSRDITQERQDREDRRTSEERFRSLTELSSDGYWETDTDGRITFISGGLLRVLGVNEAALIGRHLDEFALDPSDSELMAYRQAIARREPFRNIAYASSLSANGAMVHISLSGEPKVEHGRIVGYRGVGRDVTAERETLQRLAQLADANRALIQNSPDSLMVFNDAGQICRAEGAVLDVLGYEPEELVGRHYLEFLVPEMHDEVRLAVERAHRSRGSIPKAITRWQRKDGGIVHLSWAGRRSGDQPHLVYTTARDVTEAHHTQLELHRVNQRLCATLESIGDAFFSLDREWRLTYINLKTARFVGRDRDAMLGKLLWEAIPEILDSSVFPHYQRAMESGESIFFEGCYEPSQAWVDVRAYPHEEGMSVYFHDITEGHETKRLAREQERRCHNMISLTPAGYIETDANGVVLDVNPALCKMSGYAREELIGQDITAFIDDDWIRNALMERGGCVSVHGKELVLRHKQGPGMHLLANLAIERDAAGNALALTAFVTDITERKRTADQLEHLATHDPLTGLPNRLLIQRRLQQMLDENPPDETVAVMFVDLDRFKRINDSMGHVVGDLILQHAARRLERTIRPGDTIGRFGDDELIVAAHCQDGRAGAAALAESLQAALAMPFDADGQEVFIGASVGIAMLTRDARTKGVLYQNANAALYRAKAAGRNHYRFFELEMAAEAKERMALEGALRHALVRGELEVRYQPQVDLCSGRVVGVEALLRWQHPVWGEVSPARFIPVAEETGTIVAIGSWVLRTSCRQAAAWRAAGLGDLRVAVNLSARQFAQSDVVQVVAAALKESGLPADQLDLELTESMVMDDLERTVALLNQLKDLGVKLSVDDFGTGYSSLAYLKRFPIDMLKIDRSFVQEISHYSYDAAIPDAIIAMAHSLGIRVIAEGVQSEVQCEVLSRRMCDEIQGFLFADALPPDEVEHLIHSGQTLPGHLLRMHRRPRTLLLVDDEPNILSALRRLLRGTGYQILTAGSGPEGLDVLATQHVDVIVSDQRMPGMTGVDFLRTVKQLYPETVRIVLSGFTELQAVTSAVNEGAIYKFLTKPWDDAQLREHIAEAFAYKEMVDENRRLSLEVRAGNQGLAAANRQLEDVLRQQQERIQHDGVMLDIVHEVLQHVPVPVVGLDDDQIIAFANTAAHRLFPQAGLPLGGDAQDLMPQVLRVLRGLKEGQTAIADLAGSGFEIAYRRMGNGTRSRGILVTLTPTTLASFPV